MQTKSTRWKQKDPQQAKTPPNGESEAHDKEDLLTGLESQAEERQQEVDSVSSQLETAQPKADFWILFFWLIGWISEKTCKASISTTILTCPLCTEAEDIDYFSVSFPASGLQRTSVRLIWNFIPALSAWTNQKDALHSKQGRLTKISLKFAADWFARLSLQISLFLNFRSKAYSGTLLS